MSQVPPPPPPTPPNNDGQWLDGFEPASPPTMQFPPQQDPYAANANPYVQVAPQKKSVWPWVLTVLIILALLVVAAVAALVWRPWEGTSASKAKETVTVTKSRHEDKDKDKNKDSKKESDKSEAADKSASKSSAKAEPKATTSERAPKRSAVDVVAEATSDHVALTDNGWQGIVAASCYRGDTWVFAAQGNGNYVTICESQGQELYYRGYFDDMGFESSAAPTPQGDYNVDAYPNSFHVTDDELLVLNSNGGVEKVYEFDSAWRG